MFIMQLDAHTHHWTSSIHTFNIKQRCSIHSTNQIGCDHK